MPGWRAMSGGHLALASCTRFSPKTRWPAAITGSIASAPKVFDTAISVTAPGARAALRQAASISARTAARREGESRRSSIVGLLRSRDVGANVDERRAWVEGV